MPSRLALLTLLFAAPALAAPAKGKGAARVGPKAAADAKVAAKAARPTGPTEPPPKPLPAGEIEKLREQLMSDQDTPAAAAAKVLGESRAASATGPLVEALALGLHPPVSEAALDALGKIRDTKSEDILVIYAGNRNPVVRRSAVRALGRLPGERPTDVLIERLGDQAPDVREAAASGLAARGEKKAEDRLFMLVKRNDMGAAGPLGTVASPDAMARLADLQGRIEDRVLATALGEFLKRSDAPDPLRLEVVKTLAKIPGADATTALIEYLGTVPEKEERPSKSEAQKIVDQRSSSR